MIKHSQTQPCRYVKKHDWKIIVGRNHKYGKNDVNGDEIPKIIARSELNLFLGIRYTDTKYPPPPKLK